MFPKTTFELGLVELFMVRIRRSLKVRQPRAMIQLQLQGQLLLRLSHPVHRRNRHRSSSSKVPVVLPGLHSQDLRTPLAQ